MPTRPEAGATWLPLTRPELAGIHAVVTRADLASTPQVVPSDGKPSHAAPRIFISAAEPSGDQHAAELIHAIVAIRPDSRFFGVAGPKMQAAGCRPIEDFTARSTMLVGAVRLAGHAWRLWRQVGRMLTAEPADLAILVDSPTLHLPMAKRIRKAGCPVLYYVAPQLWAWAPWRIRRVRARVNRLAAILPFEEAYFRERGVDARFVGHPLIEQLAARKVPPEAVAQFAAAGRPLIACLPGSRSHVVREVLPGQIEVAQAIGRKHPAASFVFAAASESAADAIRAALAGAGLKARVEVGANGEILSAADLALVASGTATLEAAYYRTPMVVMYNGSKWGYRLVGRWLVRTPQLSLVNILAGRRIVPEFMPYYTSTVPIAAESLDILANEARRDTMRVDLDAVIRSLGAGNAARTTAEMALEMINASRGGCISPALPASTHG